MAPFLPALCIPRTPRKFPTLLAAVIAGALGGAMREPVARWVAEAMRPDPLPCCEWTDEPGIYDYARRGTLTVAGVCDRNTVGAFAARSGCVCARMGHEYRWTPLAVDGDCDPPTTATTDAVFKLEE